MLNDLAFTSTNLWMMTLTKGHTRLHDPFKYLLIRQLLHTTNNVHRNKHCSKRLVTYMRFFFTTSPSGRCWGSAVSMVTRRWVARSMFQILAEVRDLSLLQNIQTSSETHRLNEYHALFPHVWSGWGMRQTTHLHLVPRLRTSAAIHSPHTQPHCM
jgi:hypothetical protein